MAQSRNSSYRRGSWSSGEADRFLDGRLDRLAPVDEVGLNGPGEDARSRCWIGDPRRCWGSSTSILELEGPVAWACSIEVGATGVGGVTWWVGVGGLVFTGLSSAGLWDFAGGDVLVLSSPPEGFNMKLKLEREDDFALTARGREGPGTGPEPG